MRTLLLSFFLLFPLLGQVNVGRYRTIEDEGASLPSRTVLNFIGAGVSCVDNAGAAKTDCTISGGGGGGFSVPQSSQAVASYTLVSGDCGSWLLLTNAAPTVTVPAPMAGAVNGCAIFIHPTAGNATLQTGVSATVYRNQVALLQYNGATWNLHYSQFTDEPAGSIVFSRDVNGVTSPSLVTSVPRDFNGTFNAQTSGNFRFEGTNNAVGTVTSRLAKLAASNTLTVLALSDTDEPLGVCVSGCGNAGTAVIVFRGNVTVEADNTVAANDWIVVGTTTAGRARSAGTTEPTSGWILGRARTGAAAGSTFTLLIQMRKAGGGSATIDPFDFTAVRIQDRFCGTSNTGGPTFDVGQYRWRSDAIAGTSTLTLAGDANRPCYWQIVTGAVAGNGTVVAPSSFTGQPHFGFAYGNDGTWEMRFVGQIDTIASTDFAFGVQPTVGGDIITAGQNVIRVKRLSGGTVFVFEACDAAFTCSSSNSTITPANATTFTIRIRSTTAGTILFSVNGEAEVSRALNIPTVTIYPSIAIKTAAAATRQLRLFGWAFQKTGMTP